MLELTGAVCPCVSCIDVLQTVTFVVTEARHDLHFYHCAAVCTNPSSRGVIPTGSAYDFLGGSQLSNMSESIISRGLNFSSALFNCNTRANHMFWQSNSPEYCWEESLYDRQIGARCPAVGRDFPFCHCS
jgi:hypothetical protein